MFIATGRTRPSSYSAAKPGQEKPSFAMLRGLIHGTWETHEVRRTDADGFLSFTGFQGGYTLRAVAGHTSFELTEELHAQLRLSR